MKRILSATFFILLIAAVSLAQVGINSDGTQPDPSAMLDVKSSTKGILVPRVALTGINIAGPVPSPANGLLVYNTMAAGTAPNNVVPGYYRWNETRWIPIEPPQGLSPGDMQYWNGMQWVQVPAGLHGQQLSFCNGKPTWGGCSPIVSTAAVTNITTVTAESGGTVTLDGGSPVTARGVCWNTSQSPTIGSSKTMDGSGTGSFTSQVTGLTPNTVYYLRAYGTNGNGTSYGTELTFSTGCQSFITAGISIAASANPVCSGTQVTFTATPLNGGVSPIYQWKVNGNNVSGATNPTYIRVPMNNDVVQCQLTSSATCVQNNPAISNAITMTVNPLLPLSVTMSASANPVCAGATVCLTATSNCSSGNAYYMWKRNNVTVGSNSSSYCFVPTNNDQMQVMVTCSDPCIAGSPAVSNSLVITVSPSMPVSVSVVASANPVCAGIQITNTATAVNGGTSPAYQWRNNGVNISGATNSTYTYTPSNNDNISCSLTSNMNCATNNPAQSNTVIMTVYPIITIGVSIAASANPVCAGTQVTFTATPVNGGANPSYQWMKNGASIAGATNVTYQYAPANNDAITCSITSNTPCVAGSPATSNSIAMMVIASHPVSLSISASANPVAPGTTVTFTASPFNGGTSPQYQWYVNSILISGATDSTYSYTPDDGDEVSCTLNSNVVCSVGNPASSNTIVMIVAFFIGQNYGGGIIFYLDGSSQHGLIASPTEQSTGAMWGCSSILIGNTSSAIGSGQANTTAIVSGCSAMGIAARICNDLVLNGYSDWFLPSKDEIAQMYAQRSVIGGFSGPWYWSSTEYSAYLAWALYSGNGGKASLIKSDYYTVRAIRAF